MKGECRTTFQSLRTILGVNCVLYRTPFKRQLKRQVITTGHLTWDLTRPSLCCIYTLHLITFQGGKLSHLPSFLSVSLPLSLIPSPFFTHSSYPFLSHLPSPSPSTFPSSSLPPFLTRWTLRTFIQLHGSLYPQWKHCHSFRCKDRYNNKTIWTKHTFYAQWSLAVIRENHLQTDTQLLTCMCVCEYVYM